MVTINLYSSWIEIECEDHVVDLLSKSFTFKDKAKMFELTRVKKSWNFKEFKFGLSEKQKEFRDKQIQELKSQITVNPITKTSYGCKAPMGLLYKSQNLITGPITINDKRDFDLNKRSLSAVKPNLRKPQIEALAILDDLQAKGQTCGLFKIATGVGKTLLAQEMIRRNPVRTLFLVPSKSILNQTVDRFEAIFNKKNVGTFGDGVKRIGYITVATYQSVYRAEPEDFAEFNQVIFDECHRVPSDTFYEVATNKLKNAIYRYGLTAYEERADGSTILVEAATGPIIYDYPARRGIEDGYLANPFFLVYDICNTQGTFKKWSSKSGKRLETGVEAAKFYTGDDTFKMYKHWILGNDLLTNAVIRMIEGYVLDHSIVILVDEKEHGDKIMTKLKNLGIKAEFCIGGGKDNEDYIRRFNNRDLKVLLGTSTIGEGTDLIPVDVLINLQAGASKSQTKQAYGRALRNDPDPETGIPRKPSSVIIEFDFPNNYTMNRHYDIREGVAKELTDNIVKSGKLV